MCGLFGFIDLQSSLTAKQKTKIIKTLANESESRGGDATGIAYNLEQHLHIYKRALPAHRMHWSIPSQAAVVMGHTRAATQGKAKHWQNNHPFHGKTTQGGFAFAHNGVLWNDKLLRLQKELPATDIETDSYIGVQLLEQQNTLDLNSLKIMAEQLEGSFTFTVLDEQSNLYFVKGDSPICIYRFQAGFYLYASTEEILTNAVKRLGLQRWLYEEIKLTCGDLLQIDPKGNLYRGKFNTDKLTETLGWYRYYDSPAYSRHRDPFQELCFYAQSMGVSEEQVEELLLYGLDEIEIEEILYDPALLGECLDSLRYGDCREFCLG